MGSSYLRPMRTLTINLPNTADVSNKEAKLASKLYEMSKLSLGQTAELAGYSKETFRELLSDQGVSFFNYSPEELDEDIRNTEDYSL